MINNHGLDEYYFRLKLELIVQGIYNYTPQELARELTRLANTAHGSAFMDESARITQQLIDSATMKAKS